MSKQIDKTFSIFEACNYFDHRIISDFGGGSPLYKTFLMSFLVQKYKLKSFVEIGVYRGKSFFPTAFSISLNKGTSYGVDPYSLAYAMEEDVDDSIREELKIFLESSDFDKMFKNIISIKNNLFISNSIKFIRQPSELAINYFYKKKIMVDLIHIDGNHDTKNVYKDYNHYFKILNKGGFIIFDDINWPSVRVVYEEAKNKCIEVFSSETFGILMKKQNGSLNKIEANKISKDILGVSKNLLNQELLKNRKPIVYVGILTYNHINYIKQCLTSVLSQEGSFELKIIIGDDCSNDGTSEFLTKYISNLPKELRDKIIYYRNSTNLGVVPSLNKIIKKFKGSDFFTFCEGDDYYTSKSRIATHINYHKRHPATVLSFNKYKIYYQDSEFYEIYKPKIIQQGKLTTDTLISKNFIGNFTACFYNTSLLSYINDDLFKMYTVDWMFNIFCSQYGNIGYINKVLSVYRKHNRGTWSSQNETKQLQKLISYVDRYNSFLKFDYDESFNKIKNNLALLLNKNSLEKFDVVIIDDVFPHPLSTFRYQEYLSIMDKFNKTMIFVNGVSLKNLGNKSLNELLVFFKKNNPQYSNKVERLYSDIKFNSKIIYSIFLNNTYHTVVPLAEKLKIPFIFTLYPGGGFGLNNYDSDKKLKRVLKSPCFQKVIVTQKITYDYLINKKYCSKEQIDFIYGVVIPADKLIDQKNYKNFFQFDKNTLDIVFVAHKYTTLGEDKGYDVFVDVATILSKKYRFINFHVVGPFDKKVLDVSGIRNIKFYGSRDYKWINKLFQNMDIILSPNINNKIYKGSFDGFPTASVTDASLSKVAMFCTDPLNLNIKFRDKEDIVIVEHNAQEIVKMIEYYISRPELLKKIALNGCARSNFIYGHENQIKPRLKLLEYSVQNPISINNFKLWKINLTQKFLNYVGEIKFKLISHIKGLIK